MVALSHDEILDQLQKLGITVASELITYCREYAEYYSRRFVEEHCGE